MALDQLTNKKKETEQQAQRGIKGLCTLVPLAHKELRTTPAPWHMRISLLSANPQIKHNPRN